MSRIMLTKIEQKLSFYILRDPLSLGEKSTLLTADVWPLNSVDLPSTPFSQRRTILSRLHDAKI